VAERAGDHRDGAFAGVDQLAHGHEAVDHPAERDVVHVDARRAQLLRVGITLVAQRIVAGRHDEGRRHPGERPGADR